MIKFSIITVCLNAGDDLKYTIDNLLQQDYKNYEIIVKDGYSTDGSVDKLPIDEKIKVIREKDSGIYDAMNQGIKYATGDYVLFINAGDGLYCSSVLSEVVDRITSNDSVVYGHSYNLKFKAIDVVPNIITKAFCYRSMICHQATIYKTELLRERGYDTTYKISADREWLLYAIITKKYNCKYIPVIVSIFKSGGISSTDKGIKAVEAEDNRLKHCYYTKSERVLYEIKKKITLPGLRYRIARHPYFSKYYRKIIHALYGTQLEVNKNGENE